MPQEVSAELQQRRREARQPNPRARASPSSSASTLHPIFEEEFAREDMSVHKLIRKEMPERLGASSLPGRHSLRWDPPSFGAPQPGTYAPTVPRMSDDKFDSKRGPQQLSRALTLASEYNVTDRTGDSARTTGRKRASAGADEAYEAAESGLLCKKKRTNRAPPSDSPPI